MNLRQLQFLCGVVAQLAVTSQAPGQSASMPNMKMDDSASDLATAAAHEAMMGHMVADAHMKMSPAREATAADSARAAQLVQTIHQALAKYRDVRLAEADGYRKFLPNIKQPVYHFTNYANAMAERFRFDPTKPTSLLYRDEPDGTLTLIGVMYDDAPGTSLDELDRRVPLGIARWHQHVNWCVPPRGEKARWLEKKDHRPVFGPQSPIADAEACAAVGGRFLPRIFGWMVHVNAFASGDPAVIWGGEMHEH
jgi:hypothetical protein